MVIGETLGSGTDFLLDTGIIIRYLRRDRRAARLLDHLENLGRLTTSVITVLEVTLGNASLEEEKASSIFFGRYTPVDINVGIARKAAELIKSHPQLFGKGVRRGTADALIAATASVRGCVLVTLNTRYFAQVPVADLSIRAIDQALPSWT